MLQIQLTCNPAILHRNNSYEVRCTLYDFYCSLTIIAYQIDQYDFSEIFSKSHECEAKFYVQVLSERQIN